MCLYDSSGVLLLKWHGGRTAQAYCNCSFGTRGARLRPPIVIRLRSAYPRVEQPPELITDCKAISISISLRAAGLPVVSKVRLIQDVSESLKRRHSVLQTFTALIRQICGHKASTAELGR